MLIHVVDISHPNAEAQIEAVNSVLGEIGAEGKPTLMVFNKIDSLEGRQAVERFLAMHHPSVAISAATGEGVAEFLSALGAAIRPIREYVHLAVPHEKPEVIARLHSVGQVVETDYEGPEARFTARIPPHFHAEFAPFMVNRTEMA